MRELWRFDEGKMQINVLQGSSYGSVAESPNFPGMPLSEVLPQYLAKANTLVNSQQTAELLRLHL